MLIPSSASEVPPSGTLPGVEDELAEKLNVDSVPVPLRWKVAIHSPGVAVNGPGPVMLPFPINTRIFGRVVCCTKEVSVSENPPTDQIGEAGKPMGLIARPAGVVTPTPFPTKVLKSPVVLVVDTGPNVMSVDVARLSGLFEV